MPWTIPQCEAKLVQLREALDELVLLPTSGSTGKTKLDFAGKVGELEAQIDKWERRREALLNGGRAVRKERIC